MRKALILSLVLVLILALPSIAMAGKGNGKVKGDPASTESVQVGAVKEKSLAKNQSAAKGVSTLKVKSAPKDPSAPKRLLKEEKAAAKASKPVKVVLSQGAVHGQIVVDYNVPGGETASGTATLTVGRGNHVEVFETTIPWGLTNEEAIALLIEEFAPLVQEAFGLEARSLRVKSFAFDEETGIAIATVVAIHGEAPIRVKALDGEGDPEVPEVPDDEEPVDPGEEPDEELDEELDDEQGDESDEESDGESDESTTDL